MPKLVQKVGPLRIHSLNKPHGGTAFRVSGTVNGEQLRKQFSDQTAAVEWASAQAKAATIQSVVPELADAGLPIRDQLEARRVYTELKQQFPGTSLSAVWDFFRRHHTSITSVSLGEALQKYVEARAAEHENNELSGAHASRLAFFLADFGECLGPSTPLASLATADLMNFIRGDYRKPNGDEPLPLLASKTFNNRRGYLVHFFRWAVDRNYLQIDPLIGTRPFRKKTKKTPDGSVPIPVLTAEKAALIMRHVEEHHEGRLVPYFALCLFAGIRPDWRSGEIKRFSETMIADEQSIIRLPSWITKTGKARDTRISANLKLWLDAYPLSEHPIVCANFKKLLRNVRLLFGLEHDVLRHTYISMLVATSQSVGDAALQAGNTEGIVWSNYLRIGISRDEAKQFWSIVPQPSPPLRRRPKKPATVAHSIQP